ncbi:MAG: cytochrome c maturation protein CcmE [Candidatus Pelagibacter sp. TMED263]|nr:MAG: cytochrome c maturation protein CcmE [Candidatus Pelagibacter sp. TMED263]
MNAYKKIKTRVLFLFSIVVVSILFLVFIYFNLKQNILYFKTPSEVFINNDIGKDTAVRVGGMVKKDSIEQNNQEIKFILTDYKKEIMVVYKGAVPNLFAEEKGAVVEGKLNDKKYLIANRILAKHDENYMPPQMKKILKKNAE